MLDRSNCRQCGEPTCLAFAVKVYSGQRGMDECPKLHEDDIAMVGRECPKPPTAENNLEKKLEALKSRDDRLDSNLNVFFDSSSEDNLNIASIFALGTGLVRIFEKIAGTAGNLFEKTKAALTHNEKEIF